MTVIKDRFQGKTILITGSTSGIGEAAALRAGAEGANVVVTGRSEERGRSVAEKIKADGGEAVFIPADLTKEEDVHRLFDTAFETYGDIQLFVNNAGIASNPNRLDEYTSEEWHAIMDININSVFYCCRKEVQHILKHGKGGSIVNVGSVAGMRGFPSACAYVASKHAVNGLTKAIAMEYAHKNIRCNSVNPCGCGTPLNQRISLAFQKKLGEVAKQGEDPTAYMMEWLLSGKKLPPMGRDGTVDEEAAAILFFLSEDSSYITGALLGVEGGWSVY